MLLWLLWHIVLSTSAKEHYIASWQRGIDPLLFLFLISHILCRSRTLRQIFSTDYLLRTILSVVVCKNQTLSILFTALGRSHLETAISEKTSRVAGFEVPLLRRDILPTSLGAGFVVSITASWKSGDVSSSQKMQEDHLDSWGSNPVKIYSDLMPLTFLGFHTSVRARPLFYLQCCKNTLNNPITLICGWRIGHASVLLSSLWCWTFLINRSGRSSCFKLYNHAYELVQVCKVIAEDQPVFLSVNLRIIPSFLDGFVPIYLLDSAPGRLTVESIYGIH